MSAIARGLAFLFLASALAMALPVSSAVQREVRVKNPLDSILEVGFVQPETGATVKWYGIPSRQEMTYRMSDQRTIIQINTSACVGAKPQTLPDDLRIRFTIRGVGCEFVFTQY